jgi:hypothetical protein
MNSFGASENSPIATGPQDEQDSETEQREASNRDPAGHADVVSEECLAPEKRRGDRCGSNQRAGTRSQLHHGSLLVLQSSLGLPIGKRITCLGRPSGIRTHASIIGADGDGIPRRRPAGKPPDSRMGRRAA